ncbi:MAG: EndoU domain-containing protein [Pseudomonadota bacterium]
MNKNLHRIIFNAARGQRMVVAETATSLGKGRNAAAHAVVTALAFASVLLLTPASAQIKADPAAKTDQSILINNKFDMNHVLAGEINASRKATGYHAELAADGAARIRPGSAVTHNVDGTYSAQIDVWSQATSQWVQKTSNKGESTFFNPSWSEARIAYEVSEAFKNRLPSNKGEMGVSPSGVRIQFYVNSNRTTFYPAAN